MCVSRVVYTCTLTVFVCEKGTSVLSDEKKSDHMEAPKYSLGEELQLVLTSKKQW